MYRESITKAATESKPQIEVNRGFNRIKYHPKNTARTKQGEPILGLRPPITKAHVDFMGSNDGAIFLSQCFYWQATKRPHEFFYKSVREWNEEISISRGQVEKFRNFLHGKGVLDLKMIRAEGHPTYHYRINQERFDEVFQDFLDNEFRFPSQQNESEVLESEILESEILETPQREAELEEAELKVPTISEIMNGEIIDAEIVENETARCDVGWRITEGKPLQWLIDEIEKREMSEVENGRERQAVTILLNIINGDSLMENNYLEKAMRMRNKGVNLTATDLVKRYF